MSRSKPRGGAVAEELLKLIIRLLYFFPSNHQRYVPPFILHPSDGRKVQAVLHTVNNFQNPQAWVIMEEERQANEPERKPNLI